ncbi:hypothetical protein [Mycobacteroides salmoniphilum]|uniref:Uncharacterized protein n=1 Tax=Mycobacteroides salmoniphilum TaxID=404941 RepID=A0A4R8SZR3_9MYCO|nr:hypothetical protein [Mycobacteroides salmoniphilum]TEA09120.1 hypothetical protein CCUG60884_00289 [Mycobacteroides salmoniphilum]
MAGELREDVQVLTSLAVEQGTWLSQIAEAVGAAPDDDDNLLPEKVKSVVQERDQLAREVEDLRGSLMPIPRQENY